MDIFAERYDEAIREAEKLLVTDPEMRRRSKVVKKNSRGRLILIKFAISTLSKSYSPYFVHFFKS